MPTAAKTEVVIVEASPTPASRISSLARKTFDKSGGDIGKAAKLMRNQVETSPALFRELMTPLLDNAIRDALSRCARDQRSAVWNHTAVSHRSRVEALAVATARSLMDFRLPSGIPLREAGKADLAAAADFYTKQASDMAWKGRWLSSIAAKLGNAPVGEALSEDDLATLQKDAAL